MRPQHARASVEMVVFCVSYDKALPTDPEHRKPMEVLKPMRWWVRLREILRWKSREEALKTRGNRKEEESEGFHGLNLTKRCIM